MNVLLLADDDLIAEQTILCLKKRFVRVTIAGTKRCACLASERYCDRYIPVESLDSEFLQGCLIDMIEEACSTYRIDVIMPAGMEATFTLSKLACLIKGAKTVPMPDTSTLDRLHNKASFAAFLTDNGLPHPYTFGIQTVRDLDRPEVAAPIVIKPAVGSGGIGVEVALDPDQLEESFRRLRSSKNFPLIAQEYVPGLDIDLSMLAVNGEVLAWTIQETLQPRVVRFTSNDDVLRIGREIIRRSDYSGVAHIDMRIDKRDGSVKVIEFNPRFWYTVAASATAGINFPYLLACVTLQKAFPNHKSAEIVVSYKI